MLLIVMVFLFFKCLFCVNILFKINSLVVMFLKFCLSVSLIAYAMQGVAQNPEEVLKVPVTNPSVNQRFVYASLSAPVGIGLSFRTRENHLGFSADCRVGTIPPLCFIYGVGGDLNAFYFFKAKGGSPYVSCGAGVMGGFLVCVPFVGIPYTSLRVGLQGQNSMVDVGIQFAELQKVGVFWNVMPELRIGGSW